MDDSDVFNLLADIVEELDELQRHHQEILDNWQGSPRPENGADRYTIKIRRSTYASARDKVRNIMRAHGYETIIIDDEWQVVEMEGQTNG